MTNIGGVDTGSIICYIRSSTFVYVGSSNRVFSENCRLQKFESSFHIDAARIWNAAPMAIRNAKSLATAKTKIVKFCDKLPV